jgi:hypothetical protein
LTERIVIVGGSWRGKTYWALTKLGDIPIYCTDKRTEARDPVARVTYMPENIAESDRSSYIADTWFTLPGPWCVEGVGAARALRKWTDERQWLQPPCDRVLVFRHARPEADLSRGQQAQAKGVWTVWSEIADRFAAITEHR